jgi:hypothetical protein
MDYEFSMRGERTLGIANIEFLKHPGNEDLGIRRPRFYSITKRLSLIRMFSGFSASDDDSRMPFQTIALGFGPSGWLVQNELRIARFETKWYLPVVGKDTETISPANVRAAGNALDREMRHRTPENVLETLFLPGLGNVATKFAYAQSSVDLARTAVALERYRLAHGEYPESLDALAPKFIAQVPHDVIGGGPLKYRRASDGQFVLYSVGWNERDDGGVVVTKAVGMNSDRTPILDISQGDWVWRYPKAE